METKRDAFVRLAETRTTKAIKAINNLENLANKKNYDYSEDDWNKIYQALNTALRSVNTEFKKNLSKQNNSKFSLNN